MKNKTMLNLILASSFIFFHNSFVDASFLAKRMPRAVTKISCAVQRNSLPARKMSSSQDCVPCDIVGGLVGGAVGTFCGWMVGYAGGSVLAIPAVMVSGENTRLDQWSSVGGKFGAGMGGIAGSALAGGPAGAIVFLAAVAGSAGVGLWDKNRKGKK